jgi:hypothetical protein
MSSRWGAVSGVLLVLLWSPMAVAIPILPDLPSATEVTTFWRHNMSLMQMIVCSVTVGFLFLLSLIPWRACSLLAGDSCVTNDDVDRVRKRADVHDLAQRGDRAGHCGWPDAFHQHRGHVRVAHGGIPARRAIGHLYGVDLDRECVVASIKPTGDRCDRSQNTSVITPPSPR